tara:strand:- start:456 stop:752 length:297 start_codon:yes stop_codon:yes gene_type:complete
MLTHTLLEESGSAVGASVPVTFDLNKVRTGICQFTETASGTITASIQGSMDNSNWVDVHTFSSITTTDAAVITLFPYMRVNVTNIHSTTPSIKVIIGE